MEPELKQTEKPSRQKKAKKKVGRSRQTMGGQTCEIRNRQMQASGADKRGRAGKRRTRWTDKLGRQTRQGQITQRQTGMVPTNNGRTKD